MEKTIQGLHHYGVYCADIAEAIAFYHNVLGFDYLFEASEGEGETFTKLAFLKCGGVVVELLETADPSQNTGGAFADLNHLCFRVEDIEAAVKDIAQKGYANFESEIILTPDINGVDLKWVFLRGPNGERLEFMQELPR